MPVKKKTFKIIKKNKSSSSIETDSNTVQTVEITEPVIKTQQIKPSKPSNEFRLFDFREKNVMKANAIKYTIIMYGINDKGETCQIEVDDYQPFFFVKVPSGFIS